LLKPGYGSVCANADGPLECLLIGVGPEVAGRWLSRYCNLRGRHADAGDERLVSAGKWKRQLRGSKSAYPKDTKWPWPVRCCCTCTRRCSENVEQRTAVTRSSH